VKPLYDFIFDPRNALDTHNAGLAARGLPPVAEVPTSAPMVNGPGSRVSLPVPTVTPPTTPAAPSSPPRNPFMQTVESTTVTPNVPVPQPVAPAPTWLDAARAAGPLK
jgi:hypothetical protein